MNTRGSCCHLVRLGMVAILAAGCAAPPTAPTSLSTHVPPTPTLPRNATSLAPTVGPTSTTITAMPMAVSTVPPTPTAIPTMLIRRLDGQQVLFVLYKGYEPVEHDAPRELLEGLGVNAVVASLSSGVVEGARGHEVTADLALASVYGSDYDGIVYVGGGGYGREEPEGQRVAQEAVAAGKVVAAICVAPLALARAGVLVGKRATAALGTRLLEEAGAIVTNMAVERDGRIITARSPGDVGRFADAVAAALAE